MPPCLALWALLTTACSGKGCALDLSDPARESDSSRVGAPLQEKILGEWTVRPSRAALEKARADLRKAARGDERKLDEMVKRYEQSTDGTTIEFAGGAMITRTFGREVSSDRYDVILTSGQTLTLRLARTQQETSFTFEDDNTIAADLRDLGSVTLRRR